MKTAILVVSFGTTHLDTLEHTIAATERMLAETFPQYTLYRAFTSGVVRGLLARRQLQIDSVEEALARIAADGFEQVLVQPTLLIPGIEYERLCAAVQQAAGVLQVRMGLPLLNSSRDLDAVIAVLQEAYPLNPDRALLLMGHGTAHSANRIYEQLAAKLRSLSSPVMRLCTVEGTPSFDDVLAELRALPQRKLTLAPFLFVAGEHSKIDMAGSQPDSLRSLLEAAGFEVQCVLQGMGELDGIRRLFAERLRTL